MSEKRVDIKTGFECNNNCIFCVQSHKRKLSPKPTQEILDDLKKAYDNGCRGVVLTGGEITIRKDIFDLVKYAKSLDFKTIQVQTNGRMLFYRKFCEKLIENGVTEFAPALHGHIPELHDFVTRAPGAFKQLTTGLRHLQDLKQRVISNTVVVKPNYRYLPQIMKLLAKLGVEQHQFAFVHALGNAWENFDSVVPYKSRAMPFIKDAINIGQDYGIFVMVEGVPFCMMEGYERHVSDLYIPRTEIRDNKHYNRPVVADFNEIRANECKAKFTQCEECRYNSICEGPWKEYPEKRGDSEFQPIKGTPVTDPNDIINPQPVMTQ